MLLHFTHIRSLQTGSIAGNLSIKKQHPEFPSDIFILLATIGAHLVIADGVSTTTEVSVLDYVRPATHMNKRVLLKVLLPSINSATTKVVTYKVMQMTDILLQRMW